MLRDVAFGPDPGRYPLPVPGDACGRWLRGVALGGQGRYAQARADLEIVRRSTAQPAVLSLAASTRASLLRQLGSHARASKYDGEALALVGVSRSRDPRDVPLLDEARCDALTGLAADALGCGRLALGRRLLARCRDYLDEVEDPDTLWRQHVRLDWVTAEIALAAGDFETATTHSAAAVARSADSPSVRHRIKSALLFAAAATGSPESDRALQAAEQVLADSGTYGLVPLRWAAAMLLNGVRPNAAARAVRDDCAAVLARRGGRFAT
ncbi:hypothetical protein [Rhodococcus spongiicola]|uniref:Uncharacterized protein n=1 Tax=Rhodococcus spongiicola TaxID=2487352 RepID=A0A3S3B6S6_9NOCA|nr:hypothetical protein [Rhodococcus spongiicola]RVW04475.1 hypothetical protein EF834_05170 [Rhodococcus spongiicola]